MAIAACYAPAGRIGVTIMDGTLAAKQKASIVVTQGDYQRLQGLATVARVRQPDVAEELAGELDRAGVVADGEIAPDVVRMGSTVEYRTEAGGSRTVTLVFPGEADIAQNKVSILTPIGTALLGLSPGQSLDWLARDGRRHRLTILAVRQPGG
jgi:regulator of nucleoside diphosphate kinase